MSQELNLPPCPWCKIYKGKCVRHPTGEYLPVTLGKFAWASIAGADPEPVEISEHEGKMCIYTLGCGDPFFMDDPNLVFYVNQLERPDNLLTQDQIDEKEREWRKSNSVKHGWRGPR